MKNTFKKICKEYHAGFDNGLADKNTTLVNTQKMMDGIKSDCDLVKAYWQGYYDAYNGFMRNLSTYHFFKSTK